MTRLQLVRSRLLAPPPSVGIALVCCALAVAIPTGIRASIDELVSETTFATYYPFVMVAALFLGWRYAAAVTLVAALLANFLFMHPRYVIFAGWNDTAGTVSFIFSALLTVAVAESLRRTIRQFEISRANEVHLNRELQHRVKNTIAVVQGLAMQTFRDPAVQPDLRKFEGRLRALAGANDVLREGEWETCAMPELASRALEPFKDHSIRLYGPPCALRQESCVPLVLALHELATNAVKYGALSVPDGSVQLLWALSGGHGAEGQDLILEWTEHNGPAVVPPAARGLGSRLLRAQRGIEGVQLSFPSQGVNCRLHLIGAKPLTLSLVA